MNRIEFSTAPAVINFVGWLAPRLHTLPVNLVFPSGRFVPGGLERQLIGVEAVTASYKWRATDMEVGDWEEATTHCLRLSRAIREAIAANDVALTLDAAWHIIKWGGGHKKNGAYKFLQSLDLGLVTYLEQTKNTFTLETADTNLVAPPVVAMNSMLTKVHAFLAADGLPIYDSRVAVAMATLVEAWRQATIHPDILSKTPIPEELHFPTVNARDPLRATVLSRFPNARQPIHLRAYNTTSAHLWSGAKLRLAWLIKSLLVSQPTVSFGVESLTDRMRALEAALFMIGYDVNCLQEF